jgi:hypothetical protein
LTLRESASYFGAGSWCSLRFGLSSPPAMKRTEALVWLACSLLLVAREGAAEPDRVEQLMELELQAPVACPRKEQIVAAVERLVHTSRATPLTARAVIAEDGGRFHVELASQNGQRRFEGATCRAVSEALVVILALMIDPEASTNVGAFALLDTAADREGADGDGSPAPSSEAVTPRSVDPVFPEPGSTPRLRSHVVHRERHGNGTAPPLPLRLGGAALLLTELGILPGAAVGGLGFVHVGQRVWRAELGAGLLLPRSETLPSGAGGSLRWAGAQTNGCIVFYEPWAACLGLELGRVFGKGFAVDRPRLADAAWAAMVATAAARVALGADLTFEGRLAVAVPRERPPFGIDGQLLHRPGPISTRMLLGVAFR